MTDSELLANSIEALVQRVAGTSVQEIDGLIAELQALRAQPICQPLGGGFRLSSTPLLCTSSRTPSAILAILNSI